MRGASCAAALGGKIDHLNDKNNFPHLTNFTLSIQIKEKFNK